MPGLKLLETSTILSLWVVCHGHSDLGRYHPLVGPVGIPRTWLILLLKIILAGSSPGLHGTPLYSLYTMGMCRWTGYGLLPLCRKGYMISWEFVNRVFPAGLIWFAGWILFVLQVHKSNDCNYRALLQLPINGRGVICELLLNFTVDTTHRFCFYAVKSSKPSFDQLINLVI